MSLSTSEDFSIANYKGVLNTVELIGKIRAYINLTHQKNDFKRGTILELSWALSQWSDYLSNQNFTHVSKNNEAPLNKFLIQATHTFESIYRIVQNLNFLPSETYQSKLEEYGSISKLLEDLTTNIFKLQSESYLEVDSSQSINQLNIALKLSINNDILVHLDALFNEKFTKQKEKAKIKCKTDTTIAFLLSDLVIEGQTLVIKDIFESLKIQCMKQYQIELKQEIHIPKLKYWLGDADMDFVSPQEIDRFFEMIWSSPLLKNQFLDSKVYGEDLKVNQTKLKLEFIQVSKTSKIQKGESLIIDYQGLENGGINRYPYQSVRFGRRVAQKAIPCDFFFGIEEKTISKRQFIIKPTESSYYICCTSTSNPTDFLIQPNGSYVTKDLLISFSEQICIKIKECVVMKQQETIDSEGVDMTQQKNRGRQRQQKIEEKKVVVEQNNSNIEIEEDQPERTFQKKKGGMDLVQNFFQKNPIIDSNNMTVPMKPGQEFSQSDSTCMFKEEGSNFTKIDIPKDIEEIDDDQKGNTFSKHKIKGKFDLNKIFEGVYTQSKRQDQTERNNEFATSSYKEFNDINLVPQNHIYQERQNQINNSELSSDKDGQSSVFPYLKFKLEWSEFEQDNDHFNLEAQIEAFNASVTQNTNVITIGSGEGSSIRINHPNLIRDVQCTFKYNHAERRWMVYDTESIVNKKINNRFSTLSLKDSSQKSQSQSYQLKDQSVLVVGGNFMLVNIIQP